jgi:cystathionine beta-lyase/cystathionine gamma-synthase
MMRPLDHGADLVIHSLTKYYNGHGDAMGGVVIGARELVEETRTGAMWHAGGAISPFNAWLIMRGSTTLPLRLERQCESAQAVAEFLENDPRVVHVAYPGLASHKEHVAARAQLSGGFGGVVSFAIGGAQQDRLRFVNDLRLITSAVSLGHDETLVAYEEYSAGPASAFDPPFREHGLIRLGVGLESAQDIIADLDAALTTVYSHKRQGTSRRS